MNRNNNTIDRRNAILKSLASEIDAAKNRGDLAQAQQLQVALDFQLNDPDYTELEQLHQGNHNTDPPPADPHQASAHRAEAQQQGPAKPNPYHDTHCLAAHQARMLPPPPASAPPAERLAYWQAQQQEAKDWSEAFGLRAACATNESARQRDLQDQKDWREHQARATKEVRRIRDALSKATKRWQH